MLDDYSISIADPIVGTRLAEEVIELPRAENPEFIRDPGKLCSLHDLTVAEARAFDLMLTASYARSQPIPITDELYNIFAGGEKTGG